MNVDTSLAGFEPGEAELIVTELRACWRNSDTAGAHKIFNALIGRLTPRIEGEARAWFNSRPELRDDAVANVAMLLWSRLIDLRELAGVKHWERRFHQALKTTLYDAFRHTQGKAKEKYEIADTETGGKTESDEELPTRLSRAQSESAKAALSTVFTRAVLEGLPCHQREALTLHLDGETRAEIASALGCSEKSVYNWVESAKAALRAHYTQEI